MQLKYSVNFLGFVGSRTGTGALTACKWMKMLFETKNHSGERTIKDAVISLKGIAHLKVHVLQPNSCLFGNSCLSVHAQYTLIYPVPAYISMPCCFKC